MNQNKTNMEIVKSNEILLEKIIDEFFDVVEKGFRNRITGEMIYLDYVPKEKPKYLLPQYDQRAQTVSDRYIPHRGVYL